MGEYVSADEIREMFAQAMSVMYQQEVPQYGTLLDLVADVNIGVLEKHPMLLEQLTNDGEIGRLNVERHGAIRVGTPEELAGLRKVFAIMGMYPVGYYDLSVAGIPVHSTAFRPTEDAALARNPFRVFTSLLRPELIEDTTLREQALHILAQRSIFTPGCRELVDTHAQQGGLTAVQAQRFVSEALETFRWRQQACVDAQTYQALNSAHRLVADIVSFPGCHINHLTPRTLDIDRVQALMPEYGITPKNVIEGPPRRVYPILLRQTSFRALEEKVVFGEGAQGAHTARFGEIEQRGVALTPKGRRLYDSLLAEAGVAADNFAHQNQLRNTFARFPDDEPTLRQDGLAWYRYRLLPAGDANRQAIKPDDNPQALIERGWLAASPVTYEDFLPVSAAGIFQSNLGAETQVREQGHASQQAFETALGCAVKDPFALYQETENRSRRLCGLAAVNRLTGTD